MAKAKRKTYTDKEKQSFIDDVLNLMGAMSETEACKKSDIPQSNFRRWINDTTLDVNDDLPSNKERYARERDNFIQKLASEILTISDEEPKMIEQVYFSDDGDESSAKVRIDPGDVQNRKLRIDARRWLLSKLAYKEFGDKLELSSNPDNPLTANTGNHYYNVTIGNLTKEEQKKIDANTASALNRIDET